jgi:ankyrin repeat protein
MLPGSKEDGFIELIKKEATINSTSNLKQSPLHWAAKEGDIAILNSLLEKKWTLILRTKTVKPL